MSIPNFSDIDKSASDLINRDFYHVTRANLEVKNKTPNNLDFKVTGKSAHDGAIRAALEGKYTDKALGLTFTPTWSVNNQLDAKVEVADSLAKGIKFEGLVTLVPTSQTRGANVNLHFKQSNFHLRTFFDLLKGPVARVDTVVGHEGFLVGASGGYDVKKAAMTGWSAAVGYAAKTYNTAITTDNLVLFTASYYHRVNAQVEAGAKATWDSKIGNTVGLELATKYLVDPLSFVKFKINDRGIAALAYNNTLREGVKAGFGLSFDTQKLDQATHKIGFSLTVDAA